PLEQRLHRRLALLSVIFAGVAWFLLLLGVLPVVLFGGKGISKEVTILCVLAILLSMVPALFSLGQSVAAVRSRGDRMRMALTGLVLSGTHLGLTFGSLIIDIWN